MRFKRKGSFYVYIVECKDGTYYTGFTPDIKKRIKTHNAGRGAKYTRARRPVELVWHKKYKYFKLAFLEEKRIKGLTRNDKEKIVHKYSNPKRIGRPTPIKDGPNPKRIGRPTPIKDGPKGSK